MDLEELRELLRAVSDGTTDVDAAMRALGDAPLSGYTDLGFARLDGHRGIRTGDPEVVYGEGKTPAQIVTLLGALSAGSSSRPALATRLTGEAIDAIRSAYPEALIDNVGRCAARGTMPTTTGQVAVVSAGTSDESVAAEAAFVARCFGADVRRVCDVGVAGLHRLLAERDALTEADCLIVVAGMEGALPSVVGGLVGTPIVAVPTSVGYGASFNGLAALLAMLNSCAPGVTVVNIDNGFGAGVFAARVARQCAAPSQRST